MIITSKKSYIMSKSKPQILSPKFFDRPVLEVAEEIIGKFMVREIDHQITRVMISEVEAYDGPQDLACHARHGQTQRNKALYGDPGHFYVYLCYGMHWLMNIVTGPKNFPSALLIRGVIHGQKTVNGPGKVTKLLNVDKSFNMQPATQKTGLWFEDHGVHVNKQDVLRCPRIGVDYAGPKWSQKPYRFLLKR